MIVAAINWPSIAIGAVASVLGAGIGGFIWSRGVVGVAGNWFSSRRGEIRGTWYAILEPFDPDPKRVDKMHVRQRGQRVFGTIERVRPPARRGKWRFSGYVHGNVVVCVFYTTTPKEDPTSYGVIAVHREPKGSGGGYRGYYTRPDFEPLSSFTSDGLPRRPIAWQREHPDHDG